MASSPSFSPKIMTHDPNAKARQTLIEKIEYLRDELAKTSDPDLKASLPKEIAEAEEMLRDLQPVSKKRTWLAASVALIIVAAVLFWFRQPDPVQDLKAEFQEMGLTLNVGLASHYLPGTVIQTQKNGELLPRPEILLWPDACFPDQEPRPSPFFLPSRKGQSQLQINASEVTHFLPSLNIQGAKSWNLVLQEPQTLAFARLDISEEFSKDCLFRLERAFDGGEDITAMATIGESVVASGMTLTVEWNADANAELRSQARNQVEANLGSGEMKVESRTGAGERSVFEVKERIVLAYRTYEMEAVGSPPE